MLFTGATGRRGRLLMALLATTWASALLTWAAADGAAAGAEAALAAAAGSAAVAFQVTAETDGGAAAAPAVTRSDRAVTITAPGTYRLRGLLDGAALVVDSRVPGAVRLVLDGVRVQPAAGPALEVRAADAVLLELAPGSFNSLLAPDHDGAASPAVRSAAPLRLRGGGHLLAMARRGHGLESAARLAFEGGVVTLIGGRDGARAASLDVHAGDVTVFAAESALHATATVGAGDVGLHGGRLDLVAGGDGVRAAGSLLMTGGEVRVVTGGGHAAPVSDDDPSRKGLAAERRLEVTGGRAEVDAADDALHAREALRVAGCRLTLASGDDALHADLDLEVAGGEVRVLAAEEGLEAPRLTVSGGTLVVEARDDALNAAGDLPQEQLLLTIRGGHVVLAAGSDAVDSNGSVLVTGGVLLLNGPAAVLKPAIDRDREVRITGGSVVAAAALVLDRDTAFDDRSQPVLYVDFHWRVEAGTLVSVSGPDGFLVTYRAPRPLWTFSFTAPGLVAGQAYEVWLGGTPVGAELEGGLFAPAGVEGGNPRGARRAR